MLKDPHQSQQNAGVQHAGVQHAVWPLQQEVTRPKQRFLASNEKLAIAYYMQPNLNMHILS